ncbi:MAG: CopL family metal-binding regulatory protein [Xanthomonadales bacterium]|nr:CopL family metal-binding regulatory protein [Xanthomonadales bacterium]MCB9124608.1 CopL family metal-binding regulatory protein [Caldilineaceae bacterium]
MARTFLHVLLAMTLIFNWGLAPWAMAGAHSGTHHESPAHLLAQGAQHTHQHAAVEHAGDVATPGKPAGKSCCDPGACQCGCVLPPLLLFTGLQLSPQALAPAPLAAVADSMVVRRGTPPFRPPAV